MKKQNEVDEHLVRSGERIRESVRCLPRGHFQQIRLMFDKQNSRQLPITDDEKLREQQTNIDDIIFEDDQQYSSGKYICFRKKESKCNHLIECQIPVLSLFNKTSEIDNKTIRETIEGRHFFFHEIRVVRFLNQHTKQNE
jgi:hypothetical protein